MKEEEEAASDEEVRVIEVENKRQRVNEGYLQGDHVMALQRLQALR